MSSCNVPTLHQQDGGLTMQEFADKEGLTLKQAMTAARGGKILGARQDGRSKRWWVYPPAKLMERPRSYQRSAGVSLEVAPHSQISLTAPAAQRKQGGLSVGDFGQSAPQVEAEGTLPPESGFRDGGGFIPRAQAAPRGTLGERRAPARGFDFGVENVYRTAETRSVLAALRESAARQFREGLHYLRLDACEFAQLYAALDNERSRVRKLVGKGLVDMASLRASDSAWQKMQAMSQQGRLL